MDAPSDGQASPDRQPEGGAEFQMGVHVYKPKKNRQLKPRTAEATTARSSKMIAAAILDGLPAPTPVIATPPTATVSAASNAAAAAAAAAAAVSSLAFHFDASKLGDDDDDDDDNERKAGATADAASALLSLQLPAKAWESLSGVLSIRELSRCAAACKVWKATISQSVKVVTVYSVDGARIKQLKTIAPNLERIVFADTGVAVQLTCEGELKTLTKLTSVRVIPKTTLTSGAKQISPADAMLEFALLAPHLPIHLTKLEVPCARFNRGSLTSLEKLKSLTHLDLSKGDWRADDWHWAPLSDDPLRDDWVDHFPTSLVVLNLAYCAVLSDRILQKFKRLPRLRDLDVEGCFQLTDAGMATLGPNVESLNMAQCIGVFRKGEARRGVLPARLQKLRLSFNFNDHFILYIPDTLTCLYLEKSYVTDGGMRIILSFLKNLTELSVAACINIGDATLALLPPALRFLDLWHNRNVTDAGMKALRRCAIEVLDITSCSKLSCQGIVDMAQAPLRLIAVGALFFPDHLLKGVAILRDLVGVFGARPRLFSDTVKI